MGGPHTHDPHKHSLPNVVIDPRVKANTLYFVDPEQTYVGPARPLRLPWYTRWRITRWISHKLGRSYSATLTLK